MWADEGEDDETIAGRGNETGDRAVGDMQAVFTVIVVGGCDLVVIASVREAGEKDSRTDEGGREEEQLFVDSTLTSFLLLTVTAAGNSGADSQREESITGVAWFVIGCISMASFLPEIGCPPDAFDDFDEAEL